MSRTLAIDGGRPAFDRPRHVGEPAVADQALFLRRVADILERRRFTNNGPFVDELEHSVAARLEVAECVAVANATLALQLVLAALDLKGHVVVPSWTFIATPHAARMAGLEVRFVDVDPATHTIDTDKLLGVMDDETAAVLGVHLFGQPCDVAALEAITRPRNIPLIFDAAHALGTAVLGQPVGANGVAEVFSLHATKFVHGFEGGLITTNDEALAQELRLMRNFGFIGRDQVVRIGTNAKLSEIHAAMALTQLEAIEELRAANQVRHAAYAAGLEGVPGLEVFQPSATVRNDQYVVVDVNPVAGFTRDQLITTLEAEGVLARRYFAPGCHRQMPYAAEPAVQDAELASTERLAEQTLVLPTGANMSIPDINTVTDIMRSVAARSRRRPASEARLVTSR